jgi:hypothetical protein
MFYLGVQYSQGVPIPIRPIDYYAGKHEGPLSLPLEKDWFRGKPECERSQHVGCLFSTIWCGSDT